MREESEEYTKVYFEFFNDILDEDYVESVWATVLEEKEGTYKLKNIPLFVTGYSSEDTVYAELEEDRLVVKGLVKESGNSTLQIICFKEENAGQVQKRLEEFGCEWEGSYLPGYFSVDVSADLDYEPIKEYLADQEERETLSYREACLAH
ncbi:DUF4265 domain-containing protein [Telluribacter sp. SYSU D00476]|uniref:DUF4265 domain-containing protein n=1 Tax=Telluribacter sp. SYSU D00476 TaxID=2811430 RepID=UPI001FF412C8|nr:DUF4265 domain-containing protein [Telluribacter sp. SYSU D00476]